MDVQLELEVKDFFRHGESMMDDYGYDIIFCTDRGGIIFVNQSENIAYEMQFNNGVEVMQFFTDALRDWSNKVMWMTHDYWMTIKYGYYHIHDD